MTCCAGMLLERGADDDGHCRPLNAPNLFEAATCVGEAPRLFSIYAAGNFIEASRDTSLDEGAKCALIRNRRGEEVRRVFQDLPNPDWQTATD